MHAPDPSPQNKLLLVKAYFSSERFGPVAERMGKETSSNKSCSSSKKYKHTGKEVPGTSKEIMLMFDNNSDSALEDLALHDVVPGTFSMKI